MSRRTVWLVAVSILLAVLGWRVLSLAMAEHYARSQPERALAWRADHPEALSRLAQGQAEQGDWASAADSARRALRANPLDGQPLRVLAQAAEAEGRADDALALYRQAVRLAPRDLPTRFWLLQHALNDRDATDAMAQLDAILRLKPDLLPALQPQLDLLAANPLAQTAVVETLNRQPPWRAGFLAGLAKSGYPSEALAPVFGPLRGENALRELQPWLARLRAENRHAQAYLTWVGLIPEAQRDYLGNVFDGGFELEQELQAGPFAWNTPPLAGAQAYWSATRGSVGQNSYMVQFEGRRTPFAHLWQALALPPGRWQLAWRARADRLDTPRGLVWRVLCEPRGRVLAESAPMQGRFDWREETVDLEIPADCPGQRLLLTIPARIPAETVINGTLWLDAVRMSPAPEKSVTEE
ncbi:hypothetical protein GCM10010960_05400 [Arenimonas maotaiensis]|uniref:Tetratricopeptide repeat protein n=1 Tax=Arenimonas maotaiensis TaxID=1446479 RepID=A0A917CGQ3_9GAMM|nr:BTAD domain-containing putative transcriptional regulator [Arenimonas maotaiensis]GGF86325.1 hypothetical protein GCM10010960_05400 [Arenimonas maotaiensis]